MFFDIEKDVDKGALSEALSDSAEVTVVSLSLQYLYEKYFSKTQKQPLWGRKQRHLDIWAFQPVDEQVRRNQEVY